jgi:hypothetical protein
VKLVEDRAAVKEERMWRALTITLGVALAAALAVHVVFAQSPRMHDETMHHAMMASTSPALAGQDAFAAIAEIVAILDADPNTDWTKVDLERLRQHLVDMNEVVLRSTVKQTAVTGGLSMEITGTGRTTKAIRAMVIPHAAELDRMVEWSAKAEPIPGGARLIVTTKNADDQKALARLRGLGFIGLLTEGAHHGPHHLAMARGEAITGHTH